MADTKENPTSEYNNAAYEPDEQAEADPGKDGAASGDNESRRGSSESTRSGFADIAIAMHGQTARSKGARSYKVGGLLYGDGSYYQHPYGNRGNFLAELLHPSPDADRAKISSEPLPGTLIVWFVVCMFMVGIAGAIIFGSETTNSGSSKHVQRNLSQFIDPRLV